MTSRKVKNGWLIKLAKGEKVITSLQRFSKEHGIKGAWLQGLGGVLSAEIGFYNLETKEYEFKRLEEPLEIASLMGNVATVDGEPFLHIHAVLADRNLNTYAGHLKEAVVAGTCEIYLVELGTEIRRAPDTETGLKLWDF